ncbi:helix-turn-helix transcriptional regulator [Chitinimonas arctica]|uniref:helix-turn-helix transcriptional regulator n=1 Tax=Chitinimonas arctica TaxID=2594795 RepID=UPI0015D1B849|nr:autoinducer binding domain-containing protein [Chitinimonas arctica]
MPYLEKYQAFVEAKTEMDAVFQLSTVAKRFGYDKVMFAAVPKPGAPLGGAYLRSTYPERWREIYDRRGLGRLDPTVAHCFSHTMPLVWAPDSFRGKEQRALYEEACSYGLRAGVTLPFHGPTGEVGMLTVVRDQQPGKAFVADLQDNIGHLAILRDLAFEVLRGYMQPAEAARQAPDLTKTELEYLKWLAAGKTDWEISRIMDVSIAGARFHIANLRRKFDVGRRTDVVVRAIQFGLVSV